MDLHERFGRFSLSDFVVTYLAKFLAGVGVGLLLASRISWSGWWCVVIALLVSLPSEWRYWSPKR